PSHIPGTVPSPPRGRPGEVPGGRARPGSTGSRPGPTGSSGLVPRHDPPGWPGVTLPVHVGPRVRHAALHVKGLLLHHWRQLAVGRAELVSVAEGVPDLVVDQVLAVHVEWGAVVGDALEVAAQVDQNPPGVAGRVRLAAPEDVETGGEAEVVRGPGRHQV